ncbi:MAG: tryptophan--tRNA ligase [Candidatus Sungbacteria bacterium]|nr:tryptophan--tRNA ligase [Candidatus Sungbacteria bacterium]
MKKRILSGIQPSGNLHIGNYLGAIKQWLELQDQYEAFFCVVDEHAITIPQNPKELRENTLSTAMIYLAAGIDPKKSTIFIQSHVPAHAELGWILNTMTPLGELERMTQFKDKAKRLSFEDFKELKLNLEKIKKTTQVISVIGVKAALRELEPLLEALDFRKETFAGILNYPTLMAADILLYQTDAVPVGEDQSQHVELTRSLAERFNNHFSETFKIPELLLRKETARIMGLDDPSKKMSKSAASANNYIALLDPPDEIRRKIKIAVTDSGKEVRYNEETKPAVSNLMRIYGAFSDINFQEIENRYRDKSYADFKNDLGELLTEKLTPFQKRYHELAENKKYVLDLLHKGADRAREIADKTLRHVQEKIGFILPQ